MAIDSGGGSVASSDPVAEKKPTTGEIVKRKVIDTLTSRTFWACVTSAVALALQHQGSWSFSDVQTILMPVLVWVGRETYLDGKKIEASK